MIEFIHSSSVLGAPKKRRSHRRQRRLPHDEGTSIKPSNLVRNQLEKMPIRLLRLIGRWWYNRTKWGHLPDIILRRDVNDELLDSFPNFRLDWFVLWSLVCLLFVDISCLTATNFSVTFQWIKGQILWISSLELLVSHVVTCVNKLDCWSDHKIFVTSTHEIPFEHRAHPKQNRYIMTSIFEVSYEQRN